MGTLVYLSPEQLNGKPLDHRSDIFSLGTVLYEMLCGARSFPQKTLTELVQKKTKGQYKPLDSYDLPFPKELISCIDKSMALEPHERFNNIADFGHELFAILRKVSDRAPQDLICRYMSNPLSIPVWKPPKKISTKLLISAGGIVLAAAATIILILIK